MILQASSPAASLGSKLTLKPTVVFAAVICKSLLPVTGKRAMEFTIKPPREEIDLISVHQHKHLQVHLSLQKCCCGEQYVGNSQLELINAGLQHEGCCHWCISDTRAEGDQRSICIRITEKRSIIAKSSAKGRSAGELACTEGCPGRTCHINAGHGRTWRTGGAGGIKDQGLVSNSRVFAIE